MLSFFSLSIFFFFIIIIIIRNYINWKTKKKKNYQYVNFQFFPHPSQQQNTKIPNDLFASSSSYFIFEFGNINQLNTIMKKHIQVLVTVVHSFYFFFTTLKTYLLSLFIYDIYWWWTEKTTCILYAANELFHHIYIYILCIIPQQ